MKLSQRANLFLSFAVLGLMLLALVAYLPKVSGAGVQSTSTLIATTAPQVKAFNPAKIPSYFGQDLGAFSTDTMPSGFMWNTTKTDTMTMGLLTIGAVQTTNTLVYYNSSETQLQLSAAGGSVNISFKPSSYSTQILISANLIVPENVCLPFSASKSIIQKAANSTLVTAGNEIFDWSDVGAQYSPTWNGLTSTLCISLPLGTTNIDPLALDGSGHCSDGNNPSCAAVLTTTTPNDVVIALTGVNNGNGCSAVSGGGLTWTQRFDSGGANAEVCESYAVASSTLSSASITCTDANVNGRISCIAFGISGADTSTIFDTGTGGSAFCSTTTTSASISCTLSATTNANDFLIGLAASGGGFAHTPGGSMSLITEATSGWGAAASYQIVSTTQSSFSVSFSAASSITWALIGDAVKQAASGTAYTRSVTATISLSPTVVKTDGLHASPSLTLTPLVSKQSILHAAKTILLNPLIQVICTGKCPVSQVGGLLDYPPPFVLGIVIAGIVAVFAWLQTKRHPDDGMLK